MKLRHFLIRTLVIAALATTALTASADSLGPTLDRISERGMVFLGHREASVPFYIYPLAKMSRTASVLKFVVM